MTRKDVSNNGKERVNGDDPASVLQAYSAEELHTAVGHLTPDEEAELASLLESHSEEQYDKDALRLYHHNLTACTVPDFRALETTDVYRRGQQLSELIHGPVMPAHLDLGLQRSSFPSIEFELAFGREPERGDVLRYADVEITHSPEVNALHYGSFIAAWKRQLPDLPCPLRFENGRLFSRTIPSLNNGKEWKEELSIGPQWHWWSVEYCARQDQPYPKAEDMPTIPAVVFLGVQNGKHACRPATDEELQKEMAADGGLIGLLTNKETQ